jgi:hypothetical protein
MTGRHIARPIVVALKVNGTYVRLGATHVRALRSFGEDGVLRDEWPDFQAVRALARHGWVLRSHGHFVLTQRGHDAKAALAAYYARKAVALKGDAS